MDKIHRIKELTKILHAASVAYYKDDRLIMSDKQYDDLYDELELLEKDTGFVLALSPTRKVQGYVIDGLSEATLEKFIYLGWLSSIQDIYHLKNYANKISALNGFGKRSTDKLLIAIEKSRNITLDRFLYALSIPLIGKSTSKDIANLCNYSLDSFRIVIDLEAEYAFVGLDGFGREMNKSLLLWWSTNKNDVYKLAKEFKFEIPLQKTRSGDLSGKTFVITGALSYFSNRDEAKERIQSMGGKVSGSVSAKTTYLVNNDLNSTSSKNQKAKSLGIPIINEEELLSILKGSQEE